MQSRTVLMIDPKCGRPQCNEELSRESNENERNFVSEKFVKPGALSRKPHNPEVIWFM